MRRYLLDTGPLAALLHDRPAAVELMIPWLLEHEAATSALVYAEIVEYVLPRDESGFYVQALRSLLREIYPRFLTYQVLERYARLRLQMRPPHGTGLIGDVDTLIAATALEYDLCVVTLDRDFLRVPDLDVILLDRRDLTVVERRQSK